MNAKIEKQTISRNRTKRSGQILVLLAFLLPAIIGILGLALDGGTVMLQVRTCQNGADAAALAAATQLRLGNGAATATVAAEQETWIHNGLSDATVDVYSPPLEGPFAGDQNFVEVRLKHTVDVVLIHILTGQKSIEVNARAVAGHAPATTGAAIVILDPDPAPLSIASLPLSLPSLPALIAGFEVLGLGAVEVHGAVHVNTRWGGVDEDGNPAGDGTGPPYAVACTPVLPLTKLKASDIRVVGGVDDEQFYVAINPGDPSPLRANRMAVPDPFKNLPVPTLASDSTNVRETEYGGRTIIGLPLGPPITLSPGVYDWINVVSGRVNFEPGIYIVRGEHPITKHSLSLTAGTITAAGVMFYLTDSGTYTPQSGMPDATDLETEPAAPGVGQVVPSVVINSGLLGSTFTPLDSPGSPFHGMMLYQRRHDRRPLVIIHGNLLGGGSLQGTVYAKWGHVILGGDGNCDARFVAGTMRIVALSNTQIMPFELLPHAEDVFLFE